MANRAEKLALKFGYAPSFGSRGSQVQILLPRPIRLKSASKIQKTKADSAFKQSRFVCFWTKFASLLGKFRNFPLTQKINQQHGMGEWGNGEAFH
jgi:hypothetical protein